MGCNCGPLCDPAYIAKNMIDDAHNQIDGTVNVIYCRRCSHVFGLENWN